MTAGSHKFVKFTVIKQNCQKHSGRVFASGQNAMSLLTIIPISNTSIYINVLILDYPSSILTIYWIWF